MSRAENDSRLEAGQEAKPDRESALVSGPDSTSTWPPPAPSGEVVRRLGAILLFGTILAGGLVLVALAGLLVALITEPFYPFLPFFAPLAIGIVWLAGYLMSRVASRLFPAHPARRAWVRAGWAAAILVLGLWAWGTYDLLTGPMHWQ